LFPHFPFESNSPLCRLEDVIFKMKSRPRHHNRE
jgi:hypothetical protein